MTVQLVTDNVKRCLLGDVRWHQFKIYQLDICFFARTTSQPLKIAIYVHVYGKLDSEDKYK